MTEMYFPSFVTNCLQLSFSESRHGYVLFQELICAQSIMFTMYFKATKKHH